MGFLDFLFKPERKTKKSLSTHKKHSNAIKKAFDNVKKDITEIKNQTILHNEEIKKIHQKLSELEALMSYISFNKNQENDFEVDSVTGIAQNPSLKLWENLTDLQKSIVLILNKLSLESGKRWFTMKYLSSEMYPNKSYDQVKAMISNYTDVLFEHNLIEKRRKGRETYLSLTKRASIFLPKKTVEVKNQKKAKS